ncbi:MAG: hypothetical protein QM503_14840 [Bacteroidota bacterium]
MADLLEFFKIIIPTIVVLLVVYVMLRAFTKQNSNQLNYMRNEQQLMLKRMDADGKSNNNKISMPLKFQAYERMSMFLERINPPNLLTRVLKPKTTVGTLHSLLLATIRDEYEHNMSQQLYISDMAWELVKAAKEDVVRLINSSASKFKSDEDAGKFAQSIVSVGYSIPIDKALGALKEDIRNNFT